jgi:hypothetical protein
MSAASIFVKLREKRAYSSIRESRNWKMVFIQAGKECGGRGYGFFSFSLGAGLLAIS